MLWLTVVVSAFLGGYFLGRRAYYFDNEKAFEMMQREWVRLVDLHAQTREEREMADKAQHRSIHVAKE